MSKPITTKRGRPIHWNVRKILPNGTVRLAKSNWVKRGYVDVEKGEGIGTKATILARLQHHQHEETLRAVSGLLTGWTKRGTTREEQARYYRGKIESHPEILPDLYVALKDGDITLAHRIVDNAGKKHKGRSKN